MLLILVIDIKAHGVSNFMVPMNFFLHIRRRLHNMAYICHELEYAIWDLLLSTTIICHELERQKWKIKIQVTKEKKKEKREQ